VKKQRSSTKGAKALKKPGLFTHAEHPFPKIKKAQALIPEFYHHFGGGERSRSPD
jgi:hypothetical protein